MLTSAAVTNPVAGRLESALTQVELQSTVLSVDGEVDAADVVYLASLPNLETLDLSKATIVEFDGSKLSTGVVHSVANRLPDYAFVGSNLQSVTLPNTISEIGEGAFAGSKIVKISIPSSVTEIGRSAFADCENLVEVDIPAADIPEAAFRGCKSLKKVTVTAGLTTIGARAFAGCSSLESFPFGTALVSIGADAFNATGLKSVDLAGAKSLAMLGDRAFAHCGALTSVSLPASVSKIGEGLFFDDDMLSSLKMPDNININVLPAFAFKGDTSLPDVSLPPGVTTIGDYAMAHMSQIADYHLPAAVDSIGEGAMEGWTGLRSINVKDLTAVPALGENVWAGVNQGNVYLYVPAELVDRYMQSPQWREFIISTNEQSGLDEVVTAVDAGVTAHIEGSTLKVRATDALRQVSVYDTSGRFVAIATGIDGNSVDINLDHTATGVLVVAVITEANPAMAFVVKLLYKG